MRCELKLEFDSVSRLLESIESGTWDISNGFVFVHK